MSAYREADEIGATIAEIRSARRGLGAMVRSLFGGAGDTVRFHAGGLAIVRGSRTLTIRNEAIREVSILSRLPNFEHYRIRTTDGATYHLRLHAPRSDAAWKHLSESTLQHLLEGARRALAEGSLGFGPVTADDDGLRSEFAELRWDRIVDVTMRDGMALIVMGRDHTWMEFALCDVPNPHVLMALHRERSDEPAEQRNVGETAYTALKRLAEASERAPDAVTAPLRPLSAKRNKPVDSSQ